MGFEHLRGWAGRVSPTTTGWQDRTERVVDVSREGGKGTWCGAGCKLMMGVGCLDSLVAQWLPATWILVEEREGEGVSLIIKFYDGVDDFFFSWGGGVVPSGLWP